MQALCRGDELATVGSGSTPGRGEAQKGQLRTGQGVVARGYHWRVHRAPRRAVQATGEPGRACGALSVGEQSLPRPEDFPPAPWPHDNTCPRNARARGTAGWSKNSDPSCAEWLFGPEK